MGRKPYLWEPGENEEAIEVMFPKGSTQEDREMLLYVLGYFALIVYVIFWDIGRKS